jgi:hypothetical protein
VNSETFALPSASGSSRFARDSVRLLAAYGHMLFVRVQK